MEYSINYNAEHKSTEIMFDGKPVDAIRTALKNIGYCWHSVKKIWYGYTDAETARAAIEAGEDAAAPFRDGERIPVAEVENVLQLDQFETVEEGTLYEGWKGSKNGEWKTDKELKEKILSDCKKAGIKCSIRFHKCGYLTAFTATMTINRSEIKSYKSWLDEEYRGDVKQFCPASGWNPYTREDGKIDFIYIDWSFPVSDELRENIAQSKYKNAVNHLTTSDNISIDVLKPSAARRYEVLKKIIASYNHDQSNSMIDYFDRDIYDSYALKIIEDEKADEPSKDDESAD